MAWLSRILAPVAFSPGCRGAVQYAETLACHFHSELTLLHVVAPPVGFFTALEAPAYSVMEEMSQEMLEQRKLELEKYLAPACPHVSLARQVVIGDPAHEIVSCARDLGAELIVMATHGYGPFRRFLLGSVTSKVLHDTTCPVWTGPHLEHAPPRTARRQNEYRRFLRPQFRRQRQPSAVHELDQRQQRHLRLRRRYPRLHIRLSRRILRRQAGRAFRGNADAHRGQRHRARLGPRPRPRRELRARISLYVSPQALHLGAWPSLRKSRQYGSLSRGHRRLSLGKRLRARHHALPQTGQSEIRFRTQRRTGTHPPLAGLLPPGMERRPRRVLRLHRGRPHRRIRQRFPRQSLASPARQSRRRRANGISGDHRRYLQLGGEGFILGDGSLRYGLEKIFETYYTAHIWRGVSVAFDYQHVSDPGYNRDRGPASIVSLRMRVEDAVPFDKLGGSSGK